jgi:hypothetical protein
MFDLSGLSQGLPLSRLPQVEAVQPGMGEPMLQNRVLTGRRDDNAGGDDREKTVRILSGPLRQLLLRESTVTEDLRRVALGAVQVITGATAASISVFANNEPRTAAVSDATAIDVDVAQYVVGEGPCLNAARDCELVHVDALADDRRFAHFAPLALESGVRAALSTPVVGITGRTVGSLNVYSRSGFGPLADAKADILAALTAAALATGNQAPRRS